MSLLLNKNFPETTLTGWPWNEEISSSIYNPNISWPKISIVTPSFNQGQYIEQTIRSILLQNYPNIEFIIIDGGSKDNTVEIIQKYAPWISYWVSEPDKGQSHAINKGIEKCTGEIFNWINSDDWYQKDSLHEVALNFIKNPSLQMVSGYENHIYENGTIGLWQGTFLKNTLEETIELCELTQPSTFFKLNAILKVGGVPEDMHYIMDGELWVKLLLQYGQGVFKKIDKILVNFRFHEHSKTVSNAVVDNFLFERSSIITDLQKFIGLPEEIIEFYIKEIFGTSTVYSLNRDWKINEKIITHRKLRIYFIKKYITQQFRDRNKDKTFRGLKQLIKNRSFDFFLVNLFLKLLIPY